MAVTMKNLKELLREHKMYFSDYGRSILITRGITRQRHDIFMRLHDNGELLTFTDYNFLFIDSSTDKATVFEKILQLNGKLKIGTISLSSNGKNIDFAVALPIEDQDVSFNQIRRILRVMVGTSSCHRTNLQRYIDTGYDTEREIEEAAMKLLEYNVVKNDSPDESGFEDVFRDSDSEVIELEDIDSDD